MPSEIPADRLRGILEIVRLANAETDLGALISLITQQACSLLEADRGSLYLLDKETGELYSSMALGLSGKTIRLKLHQGVAGLVAAAGQSIILDDAYSDARFYRSVDEATGYRTRQILCVPIKNRRGDVLGALELLNKRTGNFTPQDEELLSLLASQVGIALANAQLYEGLRTTLDRLSRLMKVGAAISSELDLDALLRIISQTTSHLLQAERSSVFLVDRARGELWSRVAEGLDRQEIRIPLGAGIAGTVAATGAPVRISDAYTDPRFNPEVDKRTGYQTRNILCSPMRNARGQVIGVFQVLNKRGGDFSALDEQLLASLSSQAAVAVENARLHDEVQRAYAQLQALDKMKADFLNTISHELRTPLAPILGYTEILLSGGMGALPSSCLRGVQAIEESAKRLLALIENLLVFVRLDQGEMALQREPVDVSSLIGRVAEAFQPKVEEWKLTLVREVADGLPPVMADPQELTVALSHLVDNATKFTPAGGRVTVTARLVAGDGGTAAVEIAVQDTGIGVATEHLGKIFERFYQVDGSLTRHFGGMGIGLAVVKQILEAHGSRVMVESEPGLGSTFRFALPAAA
ncbi:MAG: GAF domain-containing protein [candidate division NC10 bacterium]|nr:GAF domain-containing protein [candidate division NC10 bacterium]